MLSSFSFIILTSVLGIFSSRDVLVSAATCVDGTKVTNAKCCAVVPVVKDLQKNFFGSNEVCPSLARSVLRLAFHDAIGFSSTADVGGGADGSIITFDDVEMENPANSNLQITTFLLKRFLGRHGLSAGDLLHLAAAVGLSTCPGSPRLSFMLGRSAATVPADIHTIPETSDSADSIISRFADAGFSPHELVALMSAHSMAVANVGNEPGISPPLDSTPGVFDTQFFLETLLPGRYATGSPSDRTQVTLSPHPKVARLPSDLAIARHPATACRWQGFVNDQSSAAREFKAAMSKLSTLGQNSSNLIDCSEVIPVPLPLPHASAQFPPEFSEENVSRSCQKRASFSSLSKQARGTAIVQSCGFHIKRARSTETLLSSSRRFTQVCCSASGLPADSSIGPALESVGRSDINPARGLVGVGCKTFDLDQDSLTGCPRHRLLACPTLLNSTEGLLGLGCSPLGI